MLAGNYPESGSLRTRGGPLRKNPHVILTKQADIDICVDRLGAADNVASWQDALDKGPARLQNR